MAAQVPSRLYRSRSQKMIAGVSGGLGEYFDVDPVLIRLLFVVTTFISGVGILAYIVLWIVVPFEGDDGPRFDALKRDFDDISGRVRDYVDRPSAGRATTPRGDAPPSGSTTTAGDAAPAMAPDPVAPTGADPTASRSTTHAYEEASMSPDTTSARVPRSDDDPATPAAPAATDDLTIGADPLRSRPDSEPRAESGAARDTRTAPPVDDLYGTPYGPPPSYTTASYTSEPYAAPPMAPPTDRRKRRQHWAGAILIVLGLLILGNNLGLLWWIEPEYILPLILVAVGAWLVFGRGRRG